MCAASDSHNSVTLGRCVKQPGNPSSSTCEKDFLQSCLHSLSLSLSLSQWMVSRRVTRNNSLGQRRRSDIPSRILFRRARKRRREKYRIPLKINTSDPGPTSSVSQVEYRFELRDTEVNHGNVIALSSVRLAPVQKSIASVIAGYKLKGLLLPQR